MKYLITSALPYVNNVPHLGNLVCVISGDVFTRHLKQEKKQVISVLGTDEHGTTSEVKAREEGLTPRQLVDKYFEIHKRVYEWFQCNYTCFGRTSDKENHELTQHIFLKLYENGYIEEKEVEQPYCENCKMFLADRFIIGTCPYCGYEKARGDQCDNCGKLVDPKDLINPKCKFCGKTPVWKKTRHLYLKLDKLQALIEEWFNKKKEKWTVNAITMTEAMLKQGLQPRAITRDLKWGVKVPLKGYEEKVFYSWFDAPIGYISITKKNRTDWEEWWKNPEEVELIQFMGKDNIPFHTTMFPGMLLGTRERWTTLDRISANEYLNYEGGKFSKSLGIGVFGDDAIETGIESDLWRFYLMINRPEKTDTTFNWKDLQEKVNKELIGNIGNLFYRTLFFINKYFDGKITGKPIDIGQESIINETIKLLDDIELKKALRKAMEIGMIGNRYFQEKQPWVLVKQNKEEARQVLINLVGLIRDLSTILWSYMPGKMEELWEMMNIKQQYYEDIGKEVDIEIKNLKPLFTKIEDEDIEKYRKKYGGMKESKDEFSKLDLRVAEVIDVKPHPNADKLYVLRINLGDGERQIVAGLKKYYNPEELKGKRIIVVKNMKPAKLRGEMSQGMLLAVVTKDYSKVGVLFVEKSKPGEKVFIEGIDGEAEKEVDIKLIQKLGMKGEKGRATYKGKVLRTSSEEVKIDKEVEGMIS